MQIRNSVYGLPSILLINYLSQHSRYEGHHATPLPTKGDALRDDADNGYVGDYLLTETIGEAQVVRFG